MTTTEGAGDEPDAARRLEEYGGPGRRWFAVASAALTLETGFTIAGWAGLAAVAAGAMRRGAAEEADGVALLVVAGGLAVAAGWVAGALRDRGARAVTSRLRQRLVDALLPVVPRSGDCSPADASLAVVDLVDDVADHHAQAGPLRRSAPLSMLVVLAVTAAAFWPAAIVLVLCTALMPLNMRLAGLFAQHGAEQQLVATQRLTAVVLDSFRGMPALRELGAVERRGHTLDRAADRLTRATMSVLRRAFLSGMIMDVVITFSIAVNATYIGMSLLGYVHVPHTPRPTLFAGLLVLLVCPMYFAPMRARAAAFHERERALTAAAEIGRILIRPPGREASGPQAPGPIEPVGILLASVRYRYPGAPRDTVVADVDVAPGIWTAVTGPSGSGKTTLLALVAGQRTPSSGRVRWQASNGGQAPSLGACTWIGQQTVLLDASVRDNIRLARPDAGDDELQRAIRAAGLHLAVARLPDGLHTRLGEGGWGLSTGEARRIAIARALLRGARLWLLDEPTAHLDAESERDLLQALRRATAGCTVVVATHSFAVAAEDDAVLTIDDGVLHTATPVGVQ